MTAQTPAITKEQALALKKRDCGIAESAVRSMVTKQLKQHEFDALVSLTYNIGSGNFQKSPVRKNVNMDTVTQENFLYHNKSKGIVLRGLVRRRKMEWKLYTSGIL